MAKEKVPVHNPLELKKMLKAGEYARVYVFFGEETFLLNHYTMQLKKQLLDDLTESFNFHKLTQENFDIRSFADSVESLPMMAEHTFIWVDDIDIFKLPEDEREKMAQILADVPEYCSVLFTYETAPWNPDGRFKKLYQAVMEKAYIVEFAKQSVSDLTAWIIRHFAASGKTIAPNLCQYLIEITDGTMTSLAGEIKKVCAYSGADTIVKNDIDAVVEPVLDAVVFQMTDLLSEGRYSLALQKLETLLKMQQEPLSILGAVGGHFRRLGTARTLLDNGKNSSELQKLYGIPDYPARKTMEAARRFRPEFCAKANLLVLETDRRIKTSFDEPERLLELLILRLAQEGRND